LSDALLMVAGFEPTARIVDCNRDTVLAVLETVGAKCVSFLDRTFRDLPVHELQLMSFGRELPATGSS